MVDHDSQRQQTEAATPGGRSSPNVTNVPGVLKAFVITSGVILLIGVILLAVVIMLKAAGGESSEVADLPTAPVDVALPKGAKVDQVIANGKRLVLLTEDPDGGQYLAVVDALSGERLSLMRIVSTP